MEATSAKIERTERVFVYGTLRSAEPNHYVLEGIGAEFQSSGEIRGDVFETSWGFPCLLEGLGLVKGEIYLIPKEGLNRLDQFEGVPDLYQRRKVATTRGTLVWVYFGTGAQRGITRPRPNPST